MRTHKILALLIAAVFATAAIAADQADKSKADSSRKATGDEQPLTVLLLVPVEISNQTMNNGCWAQLYDKRNFKGDAFTMVGPMELDSADKAAGRQFRRKLDSLVTGPKATLTFYEHRMFKDRSVKFGPNSKEGGLIKKLGFSGRIESVKLDCGS